MITLIDPLPFTVTLPADTTISLGMSIDLGFQSSYLPVVILWSPPQYLDCADCEAPQALPGNDIRYSIELENQAGCIAADSILIRVNKAELPLFIPNIFSPNGDGINDLFSIEAAPGIILEIEGMTIFDRWGAVVFRLNGSFDDPIGVEWDGRRNGHELPSGVYIYLLKVVLLDGLLYTLSGDLTLVR